MQLLRTIGRQAILSTATVWLGLNAYHLLSTNFALPDPMEALLQFAQNNRWTPVITDWLRGHAWPWVSLLLIIVLRQETHRWFNIRRGRRSADRLIISWFVFIGTLLLVDWLEPAIHLTWPPLAIETSLWLAAFCAAMWVSRLVHSATRRRLRMIVKRWHIVALWSAILSRIAHRGQPYQGGTKHVPKAVSPTKRAR